jgi:hypothetical protein
VKKEKQQVKNRSVFQVMAIAFAFCLVFLGTATKAAAQSSCAQWYVASYSGNTYEYDMDEWNSSATDCVTLNGGPGFTVTNTNFNLSGGAPATYNSLWRGCHWGNCTSNNPFPIQESNIASASTAVSINMPGGYANDCAYDIWFNQSPSTGGQPNGTEVMIWNNHQGGVMPFGGYVGNVNIDGINWNVYDGRASVWNVISYMATSGNNNVNLNLVPFFQDAISKGQLQSSWWLLDVEYGFEIWRGGNGLAVNSFSVSASAGSGGGGGGGGGGGATIGNGTYRLTPQNATGLRLDDEGARTTQGNGIDIYAANGTAAQNWAATNSNVVPSGDYNFSTLGAFCLTASGTGAGSAVVLDSCNGSSAQSWQAVKTGNNYNFKPANNTGNCLDVRAAGTGNGTVVQVYTCNGTSAQAWALQ